MLQFSVEPSLHCRKIKTETPIKFNIACLFQKQLKEGPATCVCIYPVTLWSFKCLRLSIAQCRLWRPPTSLMSVHLPPSPSLSAPCSSRGPPRMGAGKEVKFFPALPHPVPGGLMILSANELEERGISWECPSTAPTGPCLAGAYLPSPRACSSELSQTPLTTVTRANSVTRRRVEEAESSPGSPSSALHCILRRKRSQG